MFGVALDRYLLGGNAILASGANVFSIGEFSLIFIL